MRLLPLFLLLLAACRTYRGDYEQFIETPLRIWLLEGAEDRPCATTDFARRVQLYGPVLENEELLVYAYRWYVGAGAEIGYLERHCAAYEPTGNEAESADGRWREYARLDAEQSDEAVRRAFAGSGSG